MFSITAAPPPWLRSAVLAVIVTLPCAGLAGAQALSLAEAQRLALQRSRQLAGSASAIHAADEMAVAAGQLPDPVLKAGIDNLPVSGADRLSLGTDFMTMRRLGVSQELTSAGKRRRRAEVYTLQADKGRAAQAAAAAAIERDTALAWLDYYFARQMADAIATQLLQARDEIQAAEAAYRGGRGTQAELLSARATVLAVEDRAGDNTRRLRSAAAMLARWTGVDAAASTQLPAIDTLRQDPVQLVEGLEHHPDVSVLARQEAIAQAEARLAEANRKPDWSVEFAFQQRGPAYGNMVSIGLSVPLQWDRKNRQDRELGARLALADQVKAEREELLRAHQAETRSMIIEWQGDRERHARLEKELLPLARARTDALAAAYRGGKATLSELLAARRSETEARLQVLQLQADAARLWAQLNFLFPATSLSKDAQ